MIRRLFCYLLGLAALYGGDESPDAMPALWARFAAPMNDFIEGRNLGLYRADKLREAVRAWRAMETQLGWRNIR